jgi:hypothetical protein
MKEISIGDREIELNYYDFNYPKSLKVEGIIEIYQNKDNSITVREDCDQYFTWDMSKEELTQFIKLIITNFELTI